MNALLRNKTKFLLKVGGQLATSTIQVYKEYLFENIIFTSLFTVKLFHLV